MMLGEATPVRVGSGIESAHFEHPEAMLADAAAVAGEAVAIVEGGRRFTYAALWAAARAWAGHLTDHDLAGRTVALALPGSAAFVPVLFGAWAAGCRVAVHNAALTPGELERSWRLVGPAALLTTPALAAVWREAGAALPPVVPVDDFAPAMHGASVPPVLRHDADAPLLMLFSGGTTGTPKAVAHSVRSLMASVEGMAHAWPVRPDCETWLSVSPQFHVYGLLFCVLSPIRARARNILAYPFRPADVLALLSEAGVSVYSGGPPATYEALLAAHGEAPLVLPTLRSCAGGGAAFPLALLRRWQTLTGVPITEAIGMTEMAPLTGNAPAHGHRPGSVGRAAPGTRIEIRDPDTGRPCAAGDDGLVLARGPGMMLGYVGNPAETARTIVDGWLHTGDIGHLDADGFLWITGRQKEMINVSGFKVFPRDIEETALLQPGIREACAIGVPDARTGEVPVLHIVADAGYDPANLTARLAARLARYKLPKAIVLMPALPRTQANKPDRQALRARWLAGG